MSTTSPPQSSLPNRLQILTSEHETLQTTLETYVSARQRLSAQQQENLSVQREFSDAAGGGDSQVVYKMIGPVLLKQDRAEARASVEARLDFIGKEIDRIEGQIKTMQEKIEIKREEVYEVQMEQQQLQEGPAPVTA